MAAELHEYFEVPIDKIDIVPNGVETAPFDALESADLSAFRERFARPGERIVFEPYTKEVYEESFAWIAAHGIFPDGEMGAGIYENAILPVSA